MQKLHLVGFTAGLDGLIFSVRRGSTSGGFTVDLDDALVQLVTDADQVRSGGMVVVAGDNRPRHSWHGSALNPRELQDRLRAGWSVEDVADAAGTDVAWVNRFAAPVRAEQAQVVRRARQLTFDKARLGPSALALGASVRRNLAERGLRVPDVDAEEGWSAFQLDDGLWVIRFDYTSRGRSQRAEWLLDVTEGRLTARDRLAAQLGHVGKGRGRASGIPPEPSLETLNRRSVRGAPPRSAGKRPATRASALPASPAPASPSPTKAKRASASAKKSAPAKKPVKKVVPTKKAAPAKKKPAKKAPVKKAPVKKAPVKKKAAPVKKAPVKKKAAPVKKAPVKKKAAPVKKKAAPVKKAPVKKKAAPVKKASAKRIAGAKKVAPAKKVVPAALAPTRATAPVQPAAPVRTATRPLREPAGGPPGGSAGGGEDAARPREAGPIGQDAPTSSRRVRLSPGANLRAAAPVITTQEPTPAGSSTSPAPPKGTRPREDRRAPAILASAADQGDQAPSEDLPLGRAAEAAATGAPTDASADQRDPGPAVNGPRSPQPSGQDRIFRSSRSSRSSEPRQESRPAGAQRDVDRHADGPAEAVVHGPLPKPAPIPVPERIREAVVEPIGAPPATQVLPVVEVGEVAFQATQGPSRLAPSPGIGATPPPGPHSRSPEDESSVVNPVFRPELARTAGDRSPARGRRARKPSPETDERSKPARASVEATAASSAAAADHPSEPSAMEALATLYPPPVDIDPKTKVRRRRLRRG